MANFSTGLSKEDGIPRSRSCTDLWCLVVFWLHIGVMIWMAMQGAEKGQIHKLLAPLDAENHFCGLDTMKDYSKLMVTNYMNVRPTPLSILSTGVCVK